jgi:hypothetical protein
MTKRVYLGHVRLDIDGRHRRVRLVGCGRWRSGGRKVTRALTFIDSAKD